MERSDQDTLRKQRAIIAEQDSRIVNQVRTITNTMSANAALRDANEVLRHQADEFLDRLIHSDDPGNAAHADADRRIGNQAKTIRAAREREKDLRDKLKAYEADGDRDTDNAALREQVKKLQKTLAQVSVIMDNQRNSMQYLHQRIARQSATLTQRDTAIADTERAMKAVIENLNKGQMIRLDQHDETV